MFDCGSSSQTNVCENVLLPFLKYYGINKIDAVFASHGDTDHTNGICRLLELSETNHIQIKQVVLPAFDREMLWGEYEALLTAATKAQVPIGFMEAGMYWQEEEDGILCLHPAVEGEIGIAAGNAGSQCFYLELQEKNNYLSVLLTGDVGGKGESSLLKRMEKYGIGQVSLLKVAHHGSRYTSSEDFLKEVRPSLSVISCGKKNRYGHPHEEVLKRLQQVKSQILDTPTYGAVVVEVGKKITLKTWKTSGN